MRKLMKDMGATVPCEACKQKEKPKESDLEFTGYSY
jgi:hypothetical protein